MIRSTPRTLPLPTQERRLTRVALTAVTIVLLVTLLLLPLAVVFAEALAHGLNVSLVVAAHAGDNQEARALRRCRTCEAS